MKILHLLVLISFGVFSSTSSKTIDPTPSSLLDFGPVSTILPTPTPETPEICGVPVPACFGDMINTNIVGVSCNVSELVGVHQIEFECKDDRPWADESSAEMCFNLEWQPVMYYVPGEGWTECPICKLYEGQCSMPNEYLGANMRYTGRSCGDKVYYGCDVGDFAGFAVDTCIRYHNTSNGKFEMRWHREFNSDKQGCHVTCLVEIKKMKIQCGSTAYPKAIDANPGSKITWKPQNGYSVTWAESICQPNGTWSKGPPCCKQDNDCSTLAVPNGKIKRKVNCVNGKHVLKVSCLPGYTLYGRKKFTCNGGITGPPGMWPPSCVPDSGPCLPPTKIQMSKIVRVTYFRTQQYASAITHYKNKSGINFKRNCFQRLG